MEKSTVLIVDDMLVNLSVLSSILSPFYRVKAANSGNKGLLAALKTPPDLILLDVMMPGMDGFEVCRRLKMDPRTRFIPVIFITSLGEVDDERIGLEIGAVDYITKPISPPIVLARVQTHLALYNQNKILELIVQQRTEEVAKSRLEIIRRLGRAAEYKDNETGLHVIRMSFYSHLIAKSIGMEDSEADIILNASPMHDIGKIGIADSILQKPGKLNAKERKIMRKHCEFGAEIIGDHDDRLLEYAKIAALTHHEHWDGSGYPGGLKGVQIPLIGRIVAIADVFDALTSIRPYKEAWSMEDAAEIIKSQSNSHFEPELVNSFLQRKDKIKEIMGTYSDKNPRKKIGKNK